MARPVEQTKPQRDPRVSTGNPGLDFILGGGLPPGKLYLVQGDPGSGKTTLALQFLLEGARHGEPVLYITLSETKAELEATARSHGWDLSNVAIHEVRTRAESNEHSDDYSVFHPSEVELSDLLADLYSEAGRIRPKRVVVDSLSEVRILARDAIRYRRNLLSLRQFFTSMGCTIVVLDATRPSPMELQSNTLPHGVIQLEHTPPSYGVRRRRLLVLKMRGVCFDDGYHDVRIRTGDGVVVYPRLVAPDEHNGHSREYAASGVREIDALAGGGLPKGTSTVIMGSAGVGKSTLSTQFVVSAARRGERSVIFTFDETARTFFSRSDGFAMNLTQLAQKGLVRVQQIEPCELAPGEFVHMVRESVEKFGAKLVVIDSLNGYMQATPDERFLLVQLHELLTYLAHRDVATIMIVAQHGVLGSNVDTVIDISYLADTVFLLRYFECEGKVRKSISVLKKRTGPHEQTIRELVLTPRGISVGEPLHEFRGVLTGTPDFTGRQSRLEGSTDGSGNCEQ